MARNDDDNDDPKDKSDAFDTEAEAENLRRIGGDDDDDTVVIDEQDDEEVDRTVDDDPDDEDGKAKDAEDEEDEDRPAKGEKMSSKLQARIDRLTARAKAAEERAAELEETVGDREERLGYAQRSGAVTAKAGVEGEIAQIESAMEAAIEAGNTKEQVKLTKSLSAAQRKLETVDGWLARNPEPKPGEKREPAAKTARVAAEAPRDRSRYMTKASQDWFDQNARWVSDPARQAERVAIAEIDAELTNEGMDDANDPARYRELQKRMLTRFPTLRELSRSPQDGGQRRQQGRQKTAGVDRDSDGPTPRDKGNRLELSSDDKRNMRNFKLDPSNDKHVKEYYRQHRQLGGRR